MSAALRLYHVPSGTTREQALERVSRGLIGLPGDRAWTVEVREHKPLRSNAQNAYLWGVVYPTILREGAALLTGSTAEELHEYFLGTHFGWKEVTTFGVRKFRPAKRSKTLSKTDFADYVHFIQQFMAERGVYIPDPSEDVYAQYGDGWQG